MRLIVYLKQDKTMSAYVRTVITPLETVTLTADTMPASLPEAYARVKAVIEKDAGYGAAWKVGGSTPPAQKALGIDEIFFAPMHEKESYPPTNWYRASKPDHHIRRRNCPARFCKSRKLSGKRHGCSLQQLRLPISLMSGVSAPKCLPARSPMGANLAFRPS